MLEIGTKAIDFTLPDETGNPVTLSSFLGKKVVVYFYPKDNTPGCTKEACAFKASFDAYRNQDIVVIGISKDSSRSHLKFKEKYELPFLLLSDETHEVMDAYEVWKEKKLYGKSFMGVTRSTYIIDEQGMILQRYEKASPDKHADEILAYLQALKNS